MPSGAIDIGGGIGGIAKLIASSTQEHAPRLKEAVRRHPELASTYFHLKGAEEVASTRIRDPADQRKFVALVRAALADSVERGEPLQPVRLKERTQPTTSATPRSSAREPDQTR